MSHQKAIEKIRSGEYSRAELVRLRDNAEALLKRGDESVVAVIAEIDKATPADKTIIFMGFCPDANFDNRLDIDWKAKGICTFDFLQSERQLERFNGIWPGDLIVLKKRQQFGKTMLLYGHGRAAGVEYDQANIRYLVMDWSAQDDIIEVPLMGCNSTVEVRTIEQVEAEMPAAFFHWLGHPNPAC